MLQDQVSDLEFPWLHLPCVAQLEFAVDRTQSGFGHVVFFSLSDPASSGVILVLNHSTRIVGVLMSTGMIASDPYASENGVSPVGTRLVLL